MTSPSLPVGRDLALAGHADRLDRQQFAADLGPGQPGGHTDQILQLDDAVAVALHAGELLEIAPGDRHLAAGSRP